MITDEARAQDSKWAKTIGCFVALGLAWAYYTNIEPQRSIDASRSAYSVEMQKCLARISYANLSEETLIKMCTQEQERVRFMQSNMPK